MFHLKEMRAIPICTSAESLSVAFHGVQSQALEVINDADWSLNSESMGQNSHIWWLQYRSFGLFRTLLRIMANYVGYTPKICHIVSRYL